MILSSRVLNFSEVFEIMQSRIIPLPLPSPDREFYNRVIQSGFARFPEREKNFKIYKSSARGPELNYLPVKMDIENVSRCNFRCTMCQVSDWPKMTRAADMRFEDFETLLLSQYGLVEIKIQGMGEPLLAADSFFKMIRLARARDLWVRTTTNASLLHIKENYKELVDSDVCETQVSIDGASAETYEAIRRNASFDRMVENVQLLNNYAESRNMLRTRMWVVLQKANIHEVELFPKLAAELGFNRLTISLDLNDWGSNRWKAQNDLVDVQNVFDLNRALSLVETSRKLGVELTYWYIDRKYSPKSPESLCPWPFERLYIGSDMRTVPCCMIANPDVYELGDATALSTVWNSEKIKDFRLAHLTGKIPSVCQSCYEGRDNIEIVADV